MSIIRELDKIPLRYFKKPKNTEILEIRVNCLDGTIRILSFFQNNNPVLTNAFFKKTQKTPLNELRISEERKKNYEEGYKQR